VKKNSLPAFLQLLEDYDLCVRDGVINANSIDTTNLTKRLILNDDKEITDLWEFLISEKEYYSIHRNDVAEAFKKANKAEFPWLKINGKYSCLQCDDFVETNNHDATKLPGLPAMQSDFKEALKQDCWTAREAICWLHGRNPLWCRGSIEDYYQSEVTSVLNAITAKKNDLTADKSSPVEWIQWAVSKGWKLPDYISEFILTGEQIDWRYWAAMPSIKACEAARLSLCIDPIKYPGSECFLGQLTDEVKNELRKCERWLESHSNTWTLPQLVDILGDNRAPDGMKNAAIEWEPNKKIAEFKTVKTKKPTNADVSKPWLVVDPKDPESKYYWYTPARYFARKLVEEDSLLLTKRDILAAKVVTLLTEVGIKKRGGKKPFDPNTIKKSLSNIDFG